MPGVVLIYHHSPWDVVVTAVVQQAGVWARKRYIPKPILLAIRKLLRVAIEVKA